MLFNFCYAIQFSFMLFNFFYAIQFSFMLFKVSILIFIAILNSYFYCNLFLFIPLRPGVLLSADLWDIITQNRLLTSTDS